MPQIELLGLTKTYRVHERESGARASFRSLFARKYKNVEAVKEVSFTLEPGEVVGFLGPNGAGKTTTLKMLSGLLYPTAGEARVLGHVPWRRERDYLRSISLVMGNRNQLVWDIPAMDSFLVNQAVYQVPEKQFRQTLDELVDLLDLGALLKKQVRSLSLGERMKCELAAALLHRPAILFLDEPTLGVDVTMQARIRQFVADYNRRHGATVILTSHYMADVTALCKRVVVIHHGSVLFDGALATLSDRIAPFKLVRVDVETEEAAERLEATTGGDGYGEVLDREGTKVRLRVPRAETSSTVARLLAEVPVIDLTVEDPPIEEVIDQIFQGTLPEEGAATAGREKEAAACP
jgi:ABC-2 type transport system ATP-binding protein